MRVRLYLRHGDDDIRGVLGQFFAGAVVCLAMAGFDQGVSFLLGFCEVNCWLRG